MKETAELALVRTRIEGDGDPEQVHHRKAGKGHAVEQRPARASEGALCRFGIEGNRRVADIRQPSQGAGELQTLVVPLELEAAAREINPRLLHTRHGVEAVLNQPDTGGAMDSLHQEVDLTGLPE